MLTHGTTPTFVSLLLLSSSFFGELLAGGRTTQGDWGLFSREDEASEDDLLEQAAEQGTVADGYIKHNASYYQTKIKTNTACGYQDKWEKGKPDM
jgi:hypothetical protein